ncbi:hypothetical protein HUN01_32105 [Nostoc edaphicum CCNP1411]|uniref:Uncharacterized protein n=1 Tax=Nostoc edaphicum CCNP1411 TaxID=1472755 RepID=A0A7D7QMX5_9NOSO|nr:hypothetical protein [Nostoc edaphicum]QMS92021.1 hypothetical protein HUN01_32105 [Nostoc edaphicum CCNP1411]
MMPSLREAFLALHICGMILLVLWDGPKSHWCQLNAKPHVRQHVRQGL